MGSNKKSKKTIKGEWIPRIIEVYEMKKINKHITNQECADILNEEFNREFDESAWRKKYQSAIQGYNLGVKEGAYSSMTEEQINRKIVAAGKARVKAMFEQKVAAEMRKELFPEIRKAAKYSLIDKALMGITDYEYEEIKFSKVKYGEGNDIPVYFTSDLHYGLDVDIKTNKFSVDIAKRRMSQLVDFIVKDIRANKYTEFIIADAGDIIEGSGNLRASQWLSTTLSMTQQIMHVSDFMTSFYLQLNSELSRSTRDIKGSIYMVSSSNHTQLRVGNTKRDEVENDDVTMIIADVIKKNIDSIGESIYTTRNEDKLDKLNEDLESEDYKLNFTYADEIILDVYGVKNLITHGHQYRNNRDIHDLIAKRDNIIIDVVFSGHWHTYTEDTVGSRGNFPKKKITLPSICGDTGYTRRLGYSSIPGAMKFTFSEKYGLTGSKFIPVD